MQDHFVVIAGKPVSRTSYRSIRRASTDRLLSELQERRKAGFVLGRAFVDTYIGLVDKDQAFGWVEQAYRGESNILERLKVSPEFDPLCGDPRFADLMRRVGLSYYSERGPGLRRRGRLAMQAASKQSPRRRRGTCPDSALARR